MEKKRTGIITSTILTSLLTGCAGAPETREESTLEARFDELNKRLTRLEEGRRRTAPTIERNIGYVSREPQEVVGENYKLVVDGFGRARIYKK